MSDARRALRNARCATESARCASHVAYRRYVAGAAKRCAVRRDGFARARVATDIGYWGGAPAR